MAAADGALSPPENSSEAASLVHMKRKRPDVSTQSNGASMESMMGRVDAPNAALQQTLGDILTVLKSYDTEPSILDMPITTCMVRSSTGEPTAKKVKLGSPETPVTVASLIQEKAYDSLESVVKDVEKASSSVLESIDPEEAPPQDTAQSHTQAPPVNTRSLTKVLAFRKVFRTLVEREERHVSGLVADVAQAQDDADGTIAFSNGSEKQRRSSSTSTRAADGRTVLTLYGSAQGPKQLFSSLQQSSQVPTPEDGTHFAMDRSVKITLPLRESTLPNIITTTQILPLPSDLPNDDKSSGSTFGELFPPHGTTPQLSPPKHSKELTTKGRTISFVPHETPHKASRKGPVPYSTQNLSTGQWLGYGGVDIPKEPTSPTAKQKSRQRALSTGEAQLPPSEATLAAVQQAKEDALFRSAYSSFAPTRDDGMAIVPEETKNQVWWQKYGQRRFQEMFFDGWPHGSADDHSVALSDEVEDLQDIVDNFVAPEPFPLAKSGAEADAEKSTEEVLQEVSELLETLASHQRIRNSSLATNPRTPVAPNASLASLAGSPSTPSSEEIDVYEALRSQLVLIIAGLPPYAVAKLNGDQLAELNLDRTILIDTKDYRGVLEEDQASRLAKASTMNATATPPLNRVGSGTISQPHYTPAVSQFSRAPSSAHTPAARASQPSQSYYGPQQTVHRSPSVHYQRSSSGPTQPYVPPVNYPAGTPRTGYPTTQAYGQQASRASYTQTTPGGQYFAPRPAPANSWNAGPSQYYQSTPQAPVQGRHHQQGPNGYQQRPQNVAPMYNYGAAPSPQMRTSSPLKAAQPQAQPQQQQQPQSAFQGPRTGYGTPITNGSSRSGGTYFSQPGLQPSSQFGNAQPSTPATVGPTGYHSSLSSEQQQMMLDRQRAQLAVQPQARMAAQGAFVRQGSGTPQPPPGASNPPPVSNAQYGGQSNVNGAPTPT